MQDKNQLVLTLFIRLLTARIFEEKLSLLLKNSVIPSALKLSLGQESIVGAMEALQADDPVFSSNRNLALATSRNSDLYALLMELFARPEGVCAGVCGQNALCDLKNAHYHSCVSPAMNLSMALGVAYSQKINQTGKVVMCVLGDGAAMSGLFFESLNIASVQQLPLLFYVENNAYCACVTTAQATLQKDVALSAKPYLMPSILVNGANTLDVYEAVKKAGAHARKNKGPVLIESKTYRLSANDYFDLQDYRTSEEIEQNTTCCPLNYLSTYMLQNAIGIKEDLLMLKEKIEGEIEEIFQRALTASNLAHIDETAQLHNQPEKNAQTQGELN